MVITPETSRGRHSQYKNLQFLSRECQENVRLQIITLSTLNWLLTVFTDRSSLCEARRVQGEYKADDLRHQALTSSLTDFMLLKTNISRMENYRSSLSFLSWPPSALTDLEFVSISFCFLLVSCNGCNDADDCHDPIIWIIMGLTQPCPGNSS